MNKIENKNQTTCKVLSVIIPAFNEEGSIREMVENLYETLSKEAIENEIFVVNDNSTDKTEEILKSLSASIPTLRYENSSLPHGYGFTVRYGLERFSGDCAAIMMADLSDSAQDLVIFYRKLQEGYDAVFGSRFIHGSHTVDYPPLKYVLNRIFNLMLKIIFRISYNDVTNAFKLYSKDAVEGLKPLLSPHFNMTVELPLKIITRGYSYAVIPNSWLNRKAGESKLKIKEMGSRYLFIVFYCLIEKWFSSGDFMKH